jgi:nucleoside-diphosphate-sugar epimerase
MKVFVAGATGVLGRRAVRDLVAAGHEVTGVARSEERAALLVSLGARPVRVDLFDAAAVKEAVVGHDAVVNVATHVPPPGRAVIPGAWGEHARLRTEGARNLVDAAIATGASVYVQESLAFLYEDAGDRWIDEDQPLLHGRLAAPVRAAEAEVARFTASGGRGVALRFGQFSSADSVHTRALVQAARRGVSMHLGPADGYGPVVSCDDAARAVVAALDAPAGTYNVVDDEPMTQRQLDAALAAAVGVRRLRRAPLVGRFVPSNRSSNRRFKAATGWAPRDRPVADGFPALAAAVPGERLPLLLSVGLAVLGSSALYLGVYATFWPRGFYDVFPNGRAWVAMDGPFNEHLVRDFGGLNLALACTVLAAAVLGGRWLVRTAAAASLLFGVPHLVYHLRHLQHYDGVDKAANVVTLGGSVVIAAVILVVSLRTTRSRTPGPWTASGRPA